MSRALPRGTRGREVRDPTRQPGLQPACLDDLDWGLDVGRSPPGPQDELGGLDDGFPQAGLRGQDRVRGPQGGVRQGGQQQGNEGDGAIYRGQPDETVLRRPPTANLPHARQVTEDEEVFDGPDLSDPEVRAAVGFMTGTFKIPLMDPDIPDVWVENVRDALFSSGMAAIYRAADCRVKAEVPVRLRNEAGAIPRWKHAYAWSAVRRSLNSMPDLFKRTGRLKFADIEGMVRCVLDVFQKRSQGVEIRLRDEVSAANLADYPSLASYIADMELRYSKLAGHGVTMTDGEQRYHLFNRTKLV